MNKPMENQLERGDDKGKIVMIYVCVAIICAIIIACFIFLGKYSRGISMANTENGSNIVINKQQMTVEESIGKFDIMKLEKDFTATNQDGEIVTLQSLKGKVWVFGQFYGSCPECNKVNLEILTDLYKKHEDNPDFQIVTVSVMEEEDGVKSMKNMAETRNVKTDNWWFLTADVDAVNTFCSDHMLYAKFEENTNKEGGGMQGAILHDMGMAVFNSDMIMKAKVDVYVPLKKDNQLLADLKIKQLNLEVDAALDALKAPKENEDNE